MAATSVFTPKAAPSSKLRVVYDTEGREIEVRPTVTVFLEVLSLCSAWNLRQLSDEHGHGH